MQPSADQLVVRQHERFHCRLPGTVRVADDAVEQVVLARSVGDGGGGLDIFVTDCSRGGLGIQSPVFIPRGCKLEVSVRHPTPGQPGVKDLLVRVQRVSMLDRTPTYYLGLSFAPKTGTATEHEQRVATLMAIARQGSMPPGSDRKGGA